MPSATPTPAENVASLFRCLTLKVAERSMWGPLSSALMLLIGHRLRGINQRVRRLIDRIAAGRYVPRRASPRPSPSRSPAIRRARPPNPAPQKFGWLVTLVPEAAQHRAQLEHLLRDPEMNALIAAAPGAMARPLRSLCWMLRLPPPPILARPKPAEPPPTPPPTVAETAPPGNPPRPAHPPAPGAKPAPGRPTPPHARAPPLPD